MPLRVVVLMYGLAVAYHFPLMSVTGQVFNLSNWGFRQQFPAADFEGFDPIAIAYSQGHLYVMDSFFPLVRLFRRQAKPLSPSSSRSLFSGKSRVDVHFPSQAVGESRTKPEMLACFTLHSSCCTSLRLLFCVLKAQWTVKSLKLPVATAKPKKCPVAIAP